MSGDVPIFFSLDEAKEPHPAIYATVRYWEENGLRGVLPFERKDVSSGFVLEYGNSTFRDYHSIVAVDTGKTLRVLVNQKERALRDDDARQIRAMFAKLDGHRKSGRNINYYVKDGDVYLLTLITKRGMSKIPYYAPDFDERSAVNDDISLLRDMLSIEKALRG